MFVVAIGGRLQTKCFCEFALAATARIALTKLDYTPDYRFFVEILHKFRKYEKLLLNIRKSGDILCASTV